MSQFDTSEYKITYLLGAGASAKVLPTVKATANTEGMAQAFINFGKKLSVDFGTKSKYKAYLKHFVEDLNWLADHSNKFGTPDTFAKYLYLHQDKNNLDKLKNTLSLYFTYEQTINGKIDDRPLIFLTTILQDGKSFPKNIKILNWNYDFQLQFAAEGFKEEHFDFTRGYETTPPLIGYYPPLGYAETENYTYDISNISMVHLNGIAGFYFFGQEQTIRNYYLENRAKNFDDLFDKLLENRQRKSNLLTFAWEEKTAAAFYLKNRIAKAVNIIEETNILVVIGYSFPFFNRIIDKQIFEALKTSGKLKKIYYQDPYRSGDFLRNQFDLPKDIEILHVENVDNYFVPMEL